MQMMTDEILEQCNYDEKYKIKIIKNTLLSEIINKEEIEVNSRHGYKIKNLGENKACSIAFDGVIEAIFKENLKFNLGIQWHLELLNDENSYKIFEKLVKSTIK